MSIWLWVAVGILSGAVLGLLAKVCVMQKAAREIEEELKRKLAADTNTLISISSRDPYMKRLAASVNDELRKLRKERQRFQRGDLELKQAVTNISHDLRTPLTAISGYLDLLEEEEKSEAVNRYVKIIRNRTGVLKELTGELFRYSVITSKEYDDTVMPLSVNRILEESILGFYAALRERGITPKVHMPDIQVIRNVNEASLSRVFSNLIHNAMKYSDGDLEVTLTQEGEIIFANTAAGLTEVQVNRFFDRFYTVEDARKATGLGLAIARTLVEQMGGRIQAVYKNQRLCICVSFFG